MLTLSNTQGFSQETIDKMNAEVSKWMETEISKMLVEIDGYESVLKYYERVMMKKYRGA